MKLVVQPQESATINIGGDAKFVSEPPMDMFTKRSAIVAYLTFLEASIENTFSESKYAHTVIAAGSVINEPNNEPSIKMVNHQASNVWPISLTKNNMIFSKKRKIGRLEAMTMMTIINKGSV